MKTIKDITGESIEVTDLNAAIEQCKMCADSPYKIPSGHTVGENHRFMLAQLERMKQEERRERWLSTTQKRIADGKRFTKEDMAYEIGRFDVYHPAHIYWDKMKREEIVSAFNVLFGTQIE